MKILVVGAGLYGAVMAHEAAKKGNNVLVIDQRDHLAGNIYTKEIKGIQVHQYGAHIFTHRIGGSGRLFSNSRNSTAIRTVQSQITTARSIICRLI